MNDKQEQKRISKPELRRLSALLDSREIEILQTINNVKFITANQLQRIFFTKNENQATNLRACNRQVNKLKKYGLIASLEQRIGGKRAGSGSTIWTISSAGFQLLRLDEIKSMKGTRKKLYEPNILFLEHTLAISEAFARLKELDQQKKIELLEVQHEPRCWRTFSLKNTPTFLKPDLFARFAQTDEYEEFYFLELDQATEAPSRVVKKCKFYISYYNSGIEQRSNGVFPYVVWITVNEKRREQLTRYIHEYLPKAEMLFRVITIDEFETLLTGDQTERKED
ncbi:replication-relaxation family protein [Enterococcus sp. BWM-S5]|uniref:Replication-relaxation family protein n=1 Tax=Enterococcus larvae TaxID=2794352 RepID=A0ABS4CHF5_9ENTE|nr:replication-relaxation family protein [Enterococcus larvae]MBP1045638.1 replication-relaxation family protein [Enterococcus larvae]